MIYLLFHYCVPVFFRGHFIFVVEPLSAKKYDREIHKYSSLVKAESKIREKKTRIAKIAQTRKLGDREKNGYTVFREIKLIFNTRDGIHPKLY